MDFSELKLITNRMRGSLIEMSHRAKGAHLGSSISCVDILAVLYWNILNLDPKNPTDPIRDRFILSKGHAAAALYTTLAYRGFFPIELLETYGKTGSCLPEHPGRFCVPGVEVATGSLGHGLPIGLGMATAARIKKYPFRVFVLMSDGECNEGSVWEAAMLAASTKTDNLIAFIDYNKWQATGRSKEIMALEPLKQKWESFGWDAYEINGNDLESIYYTIKSAISNTGKPKIIIANTIKGKGVSFMEDDNNWHYRIPNEEEVIKSKMELGL